LYSNDNPTAKEVWRLVLLIVRDKEIQQTFLVLLVQLLVFYLKYLAN